MTIALYAATGVIAAVATIYFAWRNGDFRKFLAGAFFVSAGIQVYLYFAGVSVPLLGTGLVQTPELSGARSAIHFVLFLVCFYFSFFKRPKDSST